MTRDSLVQQCLTRKVTNELKKAQYHLAFSVYMGCSKPDRHFTRISTQHSALSKTVSLKMLSEEIFQDISSQRLWRVQRSRKMEDAEDVRAYLVTLNQGEHNDWRLPTRQELYQLFSKFDLKQNGEVKIRLEGNYWLIDDMGRAQIGAWEIGDQCGPSRTFYNGKSGYIRAVHP